MNDEKPSCWFVQVRLTDKPLRFASLLAVAHTEKSARMQARKQLGKGPAILYVNPVKYAHAWKIDFQPFR